MAQQRTITISANGNAFTLSNNAGVIYYQGSTAATECYYGANTGFITLQNIYIGVPVLIDQAFSDLINAATGVAFTSLANFQSFAALNFFRKATGGGGTITPSQLNLWTQNLKLPLKYGSFGDSTAAFEGSQGTDISIMNVAGASLNAIRLPTHLPFFSRGRLMPVANGGISGQTTTQMVARDTLAASSNRRAISDIAAIGPDIVFVMCGVNDIRTITAATSGAVALAILATAVANTTNILQRCYASGMQPIFINIGGQSYGTAQTGTTADVDAQNIYLLLYNSQMKTLMSTLNYGLYIDLASQVSNATTGYYNAGMSLDGLHLGQNGAIFGAKYTWVIIYALIGSPPLLNSVIDMSRLAAAKNTLKKPSNSFKNLFANPVFANSSGGLSTGISVSTSIAGTASTVNSIGILNDTPVQNIVVTPATFDANGNQQIRINIDIPIYGATPVTQMAAGDCAIGCCDLVIDDGSGGTPSNVSAYGGRLIFVYAAGNIYHLCPNPNPTVVHEQFTAILDGQICTQPQISPKISSLLTDCKMNIDVVATTTTPYRVRLSNIDIVKIPKDISDIAFNGITTAGQIVLVAGVATVSLATITSGSSGFASLVTQGGTPGSTYQCVCTDGVLTITSKNASGTVTTDTSTVKYFIIN